MHVFESLESRRLLAAVSLDASFGNSSGVTFTDLGGNYDWADQFLVQTDGKLVITGNGPSLTYGVARYNADGKPDTSFDGDGKRVFTDTYGWPAGATLQADGKILISGKLWNRTLEREEVVIFRINANGSNDTTFGGGTGRIAFVQGTTYLNPKFIHELPDKKLLIGGAIDSGNWFFARFNSNGTIDNTFGGGDGVITFDWGYYDILRAIAFQSDGKIVAVGYREKGGTSNEIGHVVRLNSNFTVDDSFGVAGQVDIDWSGGLQANFNYITDAHVMSDGRILVSGHGLARLMPDGKFDMTFGGGDGHMPLDNRSTHSPVATILPSGKILVAGGHTWPDYRIDLKLSRYNSNGTPDTSFDGDGHYIKDLGGNVNDEGVVGVHVDSAGRMIVGGEKDSSGEYFVARFVEGTPPPPPPPPPGTGSIAGQLFNDLDGDAVKDAGEGALANWKVFLDADKDGVLDTGEKTATTDASGNYKFTALAAPGTYRVREVLPAGWRRTTPASGYHEVSLAAGATVANKNFGNTQNVLISGSLWNDLDGDGVKETGEGALGNWKVFIDANRNGLLDAGEKNVLTHSSGAYSFKDLKAGAYRVREVLPSGWRRTTSAAWHDLTLAAGASSTNKNFGNTQKILIGGNVFNDLDGDRIKDAGEGGLAGWRVYVDKDNDGVFDTGEASVLSDTSGNWAFKNLLAGTYTIRIVQQTGWTRTTPTAGYFTLTLASGGSSTNRHFGERKPA